MAEGQALDRREARKGEEISKRLHPDILIEEDIELEFGDRIASGVYVEGKRECTVALLTDEVRCFIIAKRRRKQRIDLELLARKLSHEPARGLADAMVVHMPRDEADADFWRARLRIFAMRRGPQQRRTGAPVKVRYAGMKLAVVQAMVAQIEVGRSDGF